MDSNGFESSIGRMAARQLSRRRALGQSGIGLAAALGMTGLAHTAGAAQAATPVAANVTAVLLQLEQVARQGLASTNAPGMAIVVVAQDQIVYAKGFGVREVGKTAPVDIDTRFQLASVSKSIASTIVAGVIGDGAVNWDSRITDLDPDFALADAWVTREVTIRDMFCHRSGLPEHAGDLLEDMGFDRDTILHRLRFQKPGGSFRSTYAYTNFGVTAAAVAVARSAGTTWEELADARLFGPLGMTETSPRHVDFLAAANRAAGHVRVGDAYVAKYDRDADTESPAGGVSSSVRDMAQWMRLQLGNGQFAGKQLISAGALAETHRPQIVSNQPDDPSVDRAGFYGLGWNVGYNAQGGVELGHSGAHAQGWATTISLLPAAGIGIVVLTNAAPIGLAEGVARSFLDLVQLGRVQRDWIALYGHIFATAFPPDYGTAVNYANPPTSPAPALGDVVYMGRYRNDFFGEIVIAAANGGLVLQQGAQLTAFPLRHWDRDVFLYQPVGESSAGLSAVAFEIGGDEKATAVTVENLNIHGEGVFARVSAA